MSVVCGLPGVWRGYRVGEGDAVGVNIQTLDLGNAGDVAAAIDIFNSGNPWYPLTPEEFLALRPLHEGLMDQHFVVRDAGDVIVALGRVGQEKFEYVEGKYDVFVTVAPDSRRKGIGTALHDFLLEVVQENEGHATSAYVDRTDPGWQACAERWGYAVVQTLCDVALDVKEAVVPGEAELESLCVEAGVVVQSIAQLRQSVPDALRRFHALLEEVKHDIPTTDPLPERSFDDFRKTQDLPYCLPDAQFVALRGDSWIGVSSLWRRGADAVLQTGITGVVRGERGKGVASLLKAHAVHYARRRGAPTILADNAEENGPMRAINQRIGFKPLPGTVKMELTLGS